MLREFVYLDEISVFSLIASRLGPVATEFTETERASLKAEVAGAGGSYELGSQVLRKSTVQTTFKELYELEMNSFAMRPITEKQRPPKVNSLNDLMYQREILAAEGWIVDPSKLARGQLLEVEVQLEAEDIFRVSSVVSAILEIIETNPEMFGVENKNVAQAKAVGRVLEKLLVGLVPLRGLAVDYMVLKFDDREWIVHRNLLKALSETEALSTRPLYLVGVADQTLFWKDVRRILFANARFRVLCRLAQNDIQNSWTPVKLAHILDLIRPGLGKEVDNLGSVVLASMVNASKTEQNTDRKKLMRDALIGYAKLLADHQGQTISDNELSQAGLLSEKQCNSFGSLEERRNAFDSIATFLSARLNLELDRIVIAQYRAVALVDAGLDLSGKPTSLGLADSTSPDVSEKRFLDSEFVAIYW
ncbi:MAG: hypothetical protein JWM21_3889 [Acidobacteria bacterium]|nr:hypothetical protein [Acidobacteriota bacterium]